jgi:GTP cyclohydrolase II/3,4-dihydroxy-2-butanone 4-phosphate synthase
MGARAETGATRRIASTRMPTKWGLFKATGYVQDVANASAGAALAITLGDPTTAAAPLLRIHAQCFTGEILGSLRCDCGEQLAAAMQAIAEEGCGLVIYEYQEGRGIGLTAKLKAYELRDYGLDTIEANHALGFDTDYRDYRLPVAILRDLGIDRVRLLSNSPDKMHALSKAGISVVARVPCEGTPNPYSRAYLKTKKEKLGHALELASASVNVKPSARRNERIGRSAATKRLSERQSAEFASIERAIAELGAGRMVVVVDCVAMTGARLDQLELRSMVSDSSALGGTAFTVSIDARGDGMTTGISARERARTIKAAIDASTRPDDLARPGHVFPLRARDGGVLERRGHTEAAADLARLAGFVPAGVICEIVNDDGTMARVPDLVRFCTKHELIMITVADLVRYRVDNEHESRVGVSESTLAVPQEEWLGANRASPAASRVSIDELRQEFSLA